MPNLITRTLRYCRRRFRRLKEAALGTKYSQIWIDVGAHLGEWTYFPARDDPSIRVYAFEPNLQVIAKRLGLLPNFIVIPAAIAEKDGCADFWICGYEEASSLLRFHAEGLKQWIGGEVLKGNVKVAVPTMRLDTFMNFVGIPRVDFLKIDAQGADFSVIKSLGERLKDVQKIQLEVHVTPIPLYEGAATKSDVVDYLTKAGFTLVDAQRQTSDQEENLIFVR